MAGYHVPHRATSAATYTALASYLILPVEYDCKPDQGGYNGIFPEFIHGFYNSSAVYGVDIFICYRNNYWKISYHSLSGTASPTDPSNEPILSVSGGTTVIFRTYLLSPNKIRAIVETTGGTQLGQLDVPLTANAYSAFTAGCRINREMNIASNVPDSDTFNYNAYYKNAKFYQSTLTTTSGTYVALSTSNSGKTLYADGSLPFTTTRYRYTETTSGSFVEDTSSISFTTPPNL